MKELLKGLNQRPIAYYPIYRELTGSTTAALLLSQLMYWFSKKDKFNKTDADIMQETMLTEKELRNAKLKIKNLPFIKITREGIPAKTYYEISWETYQTCLAQREVTVQPKGQNCDSQKGETITKTTTKTTTKNKKNNIKKSFEDFIELLKTTFRLYRISTFTAKINKTNSTLEAFKEIKDKDLEAIAIAYAEYVKRNKNLAVRLDKWLTAVAEGNEEAIEYARKQAPKQNKVNMFEIVDTYFDTKEQIQNEVVDAEVLR